VPTLPPTAPTFTAFFGSSLTRFSPKSGSAFADVAANANPAPIAVVVAIGAVFASATDVALLAEAVPVRRADAPVSAFLNKASIVLKAAVLGELEPDRGSVQRLTGFVFHFENQLKISDARLLAGARQRHAEVGRSSRNESRMGNGELQAFHDLRIFRANVEELVRVFTFGTFPFPARPSDVDGIGERGDRRQSGGELWSSADVIRQFVLFDDVDLHENAGESGNFVLADPHRHFRVDEAEECQQEKERSEDKRGRHLWIGVFGQRAESRSFDVTSQSMNKVSTVL